MLANRIRSTVIGSLLAAAALLLPAGLATGGAADAATTSVTATQGLSCGATLTVIAQFPDYFQATITVTNTGTVPIGHWYVAIAFLTGRQQGQQTAVTSNLFNGAIPVGGSVQTTVPIGGWVSSSPVIIRCIAAA
ncbi:cellulose binding domain-containing protein [Streptosporangiaceae bacterium NEAU-GS5]|nr:cellulose binding domain-containing protein [Streptosporangiaceae bacterium NEAU-GS5]